MGEVPTATWTVTQPWRGVFGMLVCLGIALGIAACFELEHFTLLMGAWAMCIVPIEVIVGVPWGGTYPAPRLENPWRGFAILLFMFGIATIAFTFIRQYIGGGAITPLPVVYIIGTVITTMFLAIAFGCWPFQKMSLASKGFLTLLLAYLIWTAGFRLFSFDQIMIGPGWMVPASVPFYSTGGDFAALAGINPSGPFAWESAITFYFIMIVFMFVFLHLGFWPFSKFKSLMTQPTLGIVVTISCFVCALITFAIMAWSMDIYPIRIMTNFVCYAFGILGILFMFQMWPGRLWKQPAGGFINLLLGVVIAIIAYYGIKAFCSMIWGPAFFTGIGDGYLLLGPFGYFAMATVLLGLTFPAWAVYGPCFDFWPLPPTPAPPGSS